MSLKILVIDDDKVDRMAIKKSLEPLDVEVVELSSGHRVAETMEKTEFDCVLVDYLLPDVSGIDLAAELNENFDTPIIVVTGQGDELLAVKALKAGAKDYLPKNCLEILPQTVTAVLRQYQNQQLLKRHQASLSQNLMKVNQEIDARIKRI